MSILLQYQYADHLYDLYILINGEQLLSAISIFSSSFIAVIFPLTRIYASE